MKVTLNLNITKIFIFHVYLQDRNQYSVQINQWHRRRPTAFLMVPPREAWDPTVTPPNRIVQLFPMPHPPHNRCQVCYLISNDAA